MDEPLFEFMPEGMDNYDLRENLDRLERLVQQARRALDDEAEGRMRYAVNRINLVATKMTYFVNMM